MATTLTWKDGIDKFEWRPLGTPFTTSAAGRGFAYDMRAYATRRNPYIWYWSATTYMEKYNFASDEWMYTPTFTAVGGSIAAGSVPIFVPSGSDVKGVVGSSPTTTSITLATLPNSASIQPNEWADSGAGNGYVIRIIGNKDGASSGKIEERVIIANTSGTTPTVYWTTPLTFTPQVGDSYELLAGAIMLLGAGTTAAGFLKKYDVATGTLSGNLSVTNLAATIGTDAHYAMLDEQYKPYDRLCGEGFLVGTATYDSAAFGCLQATAIASTSITGQATGGDAAVLANEYRNFQIRIVEDTGTPAAVGQRRVITSHTAGASPVYTVAAWTTTPSSNAKYVIELNNDLLLWTGGNTVTYSKRLGFNADSNWSTAAAAGGAVQYANPPASLGNAGGCSEGCWSIEPDAAKSVRHSQIIVLRGAGTVTMYQFDIAAGANGVWSTIVPQTTPNTGFTTGTCSVKDTSNLNEGRHMYVCQSGLNRFYRFDLRNRNWEPMCFLRYAESTVTVGQRLALGIFFDGAVQIPIIYKLRNNGIEFFDLVITR